MSKYKVSEPSALKFLKANGAVVDENGNVVSDASDYWKKVYDQAEPKVAKYLHADGTIDENPGSGGGADLEDNKTATIDVSTYTEPVEITPTEGKDGMKKATVTLDNIPSGGDVESNKAVTIDVSSYTTPVEVTPTAGKDSMAKATITLSNIPSPSGSATAYAWKDIDDVIYYTEFSVAPENNTVFATSKELVNNAVITFGNDTRLQSSTYSKLDDDTFGITKAGEPDPVLVRRYAQGDFTLW